MLLVDKLQMEKSIFSIGDFRHNIFDKELSQKYAASVSKNPKVFFQWDDTKNFDPKLKKDSTFTSKIKIADKKFYEEKLKKLNLV